ncbi:proliferating cell nuclear antigen, N-terminal domain-containing protein [Lentinula novae-zelandiae]|uniref:Proliferating cell nuclear antigen, N-terminal domain-containing protein n=1 Tax=Lentinula aff. lateritia TaxID=2804960 RepID=A0ACC1TMQ2_9AGAR|nr:proliferating cell nuclear antigen, N-terminal domain-containing protein [Lentinula aff. lateritia]KAJ3846261.1 proliferating cell nuclear antigen, N-terminal domain-containing protein [Lentinula lateritia]KAJ3860228.1 proliferating cell nuclear antigen, N-terminal domain-containing protein [Lentinula novae-zelandiae]KAJ3886292.1 proliferating cell nuclear antigen, N-terminal domain-containing protein [Lentinula edodes]KAJ3915886.1 proliferating cell nuclear antigen, N-terminal domain-contai
MLEAKLAEASVLKKLLDAIKELVTDANFECSEEGITLQAMDNSHVALVAVKLVQNGFKKYRCDRPMPLGVNVGSLTKVLKCAKDDDVCTLRAADEADVLNLVYEAKNSDRISSYDLKLMDIDAETLGIPKTSYEARIVLSSAEFTRIVRDLSLLGDSVRIEVSKEGVRFASDGEAANGNVLLKADDGDEDENEAVIIQMNSHVSLTFSLKYLVNFSKSSNLVKRVELYMSNDVPLLVSYDFGQGYIRYYLAPKIGDD